MTATTDGSVPVAAEPAAGSWHDAPRHPSASASPVLSVVGFEGPLDWLLEMARAQRIDLAKLSIVALVDAFVVALDDALAEQTIRADLSRWGEWLVMAATLALLRSRLLLPSDASDARAAQDEAEAMRRQLLERRVIRQAAEWLERRSQFGRDVFARGGVTGALARSERTTDITDLFRACLIVLRVPEQVDAYQLRFIKLWRVPDAMARITRKLAARPQGGPLASFLPALRAEGENQELRCRAAVASTFLGALELARDGSLVLQQEEVWQEVLIVGALYQVSERLTQRACATRSWSDSR